MLTFRTEKISPRITRIFAFATELMYLVEGDEKAALLDTGSGLGSLKACVESLTDRPVVVLLTHGHTDHAMGAGEFDDVYMNHEDDYIYVPHADPAFRRDGFDTLTDGLVYEASDIIPAAPLSSIQDLKEGDSFDLGGVHIDLYACPGHTRGSLVMLIREERMILLGDACNSFTFMHEAYSTTIAEYEKSLRRLEPLVEGQYDTVLLSHGDGRGHKEMIADVIRVCGDIRSGNTDDVPMAFRGAKGLIAKAMGPDGQRLDGGKGNIVYSKDRVE